MHTAVSKPVFISDSRAEARQRGLSFPEFGALVVEDGKLIFTEDGRQLYHDSGTGYLFRDNLSGDLIPCDRAGEPTYNIDLYMRCANEGE